MTKDMRAQLKESRKARIKELLAQEFGNMHIVHTLCVSQDLVSECRKELGISTRQKRPSRKAVALDEALQPHVLRMDQLSPMERRGLGLRLMYALKNRHSLTGIL